MQLYYEKKFMFMSFRVHACNAAKQVLDNRYDMFSFIESTTLCKSHNISAKHL